MKRIWSILFFINFFLLLGLIKPSSVSSGYCTDAPIEGYKCWSAPGYACLSYWIHCYNTATCADGWDVHMTRVVSIVMRGRVLLAL